MGKQKKILWSLMSLSLLFNNCSDEQAVIQPLDKSLDGSYRLVSMNFTEPVDIDLDGIKTRDVLSETHLISERNMYFGKFESRLNKTSGGEDYQMFFQDLPMTIVVTDTESGQFERVRYSRTQALYKCYYRIGDANIKTDGIIPGTATGFSVEKTENNGLKTVHKQHFYANEWMFLEIESEFEKIE